MGNVAVIGGGSAGAPAAKLLRKKLGREHRVILIEKEERLVNNAVLPLYAVSRRGKRHLARDSALLGREGIELIPREALKIDPAAKKIFTSREEIGYDLLLIAAGAETDRSQPPGAVEAAIDLQSLDGAEKIRASLPHFQGGEVAIIVASTRIRCPAGPYEYALLLGDWFRRQERSRDVSITVYTPEQAPLIFFGKKTSEAVAGLLLDRNIAVHPGARIKEVDPRGKKIVLENESFPFDLLFHYAAAAPPQLIKESSLGNENGWLKVDQRSMALPNDDSVFAVGDVTEILTPSGELLPKLGAVAHLQSLAVAANLARLMKGEKTGGTYSGFAG